MSGMRDPNRAAGIITVIAGAAVVVATRSFPAAAGQPVGPAAFPAAIGLAMIAAGALLVIHGLRQAHDATIPLPHWSRNRRLVLNVAAALVSVVVYALVLHRVGFLVTAALLLAVLFATFGVPRRRIAALAVGAALVIHFVFYTLLRVPLPWGVLEGIAW